MSALIDGLGPNGPLYLILVAVPLLALLVRRIPVLGTLIRLASWMVLVGALYLVVDQRGRLDPYLSRVTALLNLDDQQVVGREVRIRMSPDGHFWARARIGNVERRMLVDSGATVTALSVQTAAAAGLKPRDELFPVVLHTANGSITARTSSIDELKLGNITARHLAVVVSPAFGDSDVLGMNFLSRLQSWRVEERTLVLVPHHPQGAA